MAFDVSWKEPADEVTPSDWEASERAMEFSFGWFANPVSFADYPEAMKDNVCANNGDPCGLPEFNDKEKGDLNGKILML